MVRAAPATATDLLERAETLESVSGVGFSSLTDKQRLFAAAYVLHHGNQSKAARIAGYEHPAAAGAKAILNPKVGELVRILSIADVSMSVPMAINTLRQLCHDSQPAETRRKAAMDLLALAGIRPDVVPPPAPSTPAVVVNIGGHSSVIDGVWTQRRQRLSGIDGNMRDDDTTIDQPAKPAPPDPPVGG